MNHTPGPWTYSDEHAICERSITNNGPENYPLAVAKHGDPKKLLANARLLAAAPELLAALYDALPYVEDVLSDPAQLACFKSGVVQRHAKAIRAAIAKAEGEQ